MATQVQNDIDENGAGFNPTEFAKSIFSLIDPMRSQFGADYTSLVENPNTNPSATGESRLNTFFRILGLPAVRSEVFLNNRDDNTNCDAFVGDAKKVALSQDGTINYFSSIDSEDESTFQKIRNRDFIINKPIDKDRFAIFMYDRISFTESIAGNPRRAPLFPLLVDAAIPVYPTNRRLAPAFFHAIGGEDYIISGRTTRLSRPFLDNIIYIRSKIASGDIDPSATEELKTQIKALSDDNDKVNKILQSTDFSFIELKIYEKFIQSLKKLAADYAITIKKINELNGQVTFFPAPVANPEQRSGQTSAEPPVQATVPALEQRINELKFQIKQEEALAYILPTADIKRRDEIRRIEQNVQLKNVTEDLMVNNFTNLITYGANQLKTELSSVQEERDSLIKQAEQAKRALLYYTGEFTGLSIFDVICVLYGLFTVDFQYLIGLLNKDAQDRLVLDDFFALNPQEQSSDSISSSKNPAQLVKNNQVPSVSESLKQLEDKVKEGFLIADSFTPSA